MPLFIVWLILGLAFKTYKKFIVTATPIILISVIVLIEVYVRPWQEKVSGNDVIIPLSVYVTKFSAYLILAHIGFFVRKIAGLVKMKLHKNNEK